MEIEAEEFARKLRCGELDGACLLDVREPEEWEVYRLDDAILVPLNTLPEHVDQMDSRQPTYVYCAHGIRSRYAVAYLQQTGFKRIFHVNNGLALVLYFLERIEREQD